LQEIYVRAGGPDVTSLGRQQPEADLTRGKAEDGDRGHYHQDPFRLHLILPPAWPAEGCGTVLAGGAKEQAMLT